MRGAGREREKERRGGGRINAENAEAAEAAENAEEKDKREVPQS